MNVVTANPIVYDSGLIDGDYENAYGKRSVNRTETYENAYGKRAVNRSGRRMSSIGRKSKPRRKRTFLNRAVGVIPVVAAARYIKKRREDREDSQRQSRPSPSARKQSRPPMAQGGQYQGKQQKPVGKPSGRPVGRPNTLVNQQNIAEAPILAPTTLPEKKSNNKKIALIVGGVLLLGVAAYLYTKRKK